MRVNLLGALAMFALLFPFSALAFPVLGLDDFPFTVPRVFERVSVFDANL